MADYGTITFRARRDLDPDFNMIMEWCREHGVTFNALINSYLGAISYALQNKVFVDPKSKEMYVLSDFGHIPILEGKQPPTQETVT